MGERSKEPRTDTDSGSLDDPTRTMLQRERSGPVARTDTGPLSQSVLERSVDEAVDGLLIDALPSPGDVIAQKYRVDRMIARGGMGVVYAATHLVSGKRVALKWMLPALGEITGARERFVREACATARIDHPNIVDIYDVGNLGASVYLVMEFLRGETLSERMEREQIPEEEAIALFIPALRGVAAAHSHGVIHRDLKPDNIFLCRSPAGEPLEPKVLDFGISKIAAEDATDHSLTRSGAVLGTPYYMSPEQVRGAHDVDARTDVYAIGVMLYEVLTGSRPFEAETYNQLILKIVNEVPAPMGTLNPALDPGLVRVVERAMARDVAQRFANIEALALALEPYAGGVRFRTTTTPLERSAPKLPAPPPVATGVTTLNTLASRRRVQLTAASAVVAFGLCAAGFVWFHNADGSGANAAPDAHIARPSPLPPARLPTEGANAPSGTASTRAVPAPDAPLETSKSASADTPLAAAVPASQPTAAAIPNGQLDPVPARGASRPKPASASKTRANGDRHTASAKHLTEVLAEPTPKRVTEASAEPASKRANAGDWDDRLSNAPARPAATGITPAGRIDTRDFR